MDQAFVSSLSAYAESLALNMSMWGEGPAGGDQAWVESCGQGPASALVRGREPRAEGTARRWPSTGQEADQPGSAPASSPVSDSQPPEARDPAAGT